jgi:hypothetical protein
MLDTLLQKYDVIFSYDTAVFSDKSPVDMSRN